jgi:ATP-dependent Clp protease ATP-binding subunit ClpC
VFERFNDASHDCIKLAQAEARAHGHALIGTEHVLAALTRLELSTVAELLSDYGVTYESVCAIAFDDTIHLPTSAPVQAPFSENTKKVLEFALREALQMGHNEVSPEHILLGILRHESCTALSVIRALGVVAKDLRDDVVHRLQSRQAGFVGARSTEALPLENTRLLEQYGTNLTAQATAGSLDPVIGRENEIERLVQILSRRQKNNPILIGPPGVGKTAIVEGLAQRIVSGDVSKQLREKQIYSLDLGSMVAGTRYRGDFEERLKRIIKEIRATGNIIIFIDEIHTLIGAGAAEGAIDASSMLKPLLARGQLQTIGATTTDEYRQHFEKDAALDRRFQSIDVAPSSVTQTIEILKGLRPRYEAWHHVLYTDAALAAAAELSDRYVSDRFLPDKAIDIVDEAGARVAVNRADQDTPDDMLSALFEMPADPGESSPSELAERLALRFAIEAADRPGVIVSEETVAEVMVTWTKIPLSKLTQSDQTSLLSLETTLASRVVGQSAAIAAVARSVRRARAGIKDPRRPSGSFMFLGASGVGKTELAKALAEVLLGSDDQLITIDMSEYQEKHAASRLVGAPPGYVGYTEAGQLTEAVRKRPFSVILFDEVEKAHPDIFNLLLQILEEARLTDGQGRAVDFASTTVIMTSNLGTEEMSKAPVGFGAGAGSEGIAIKALKKHFRQEFINRIDETVVFNELSQSDVLQIVTLELARLNDQIAARGLSLDVDDESRLFLAQQGYDPDQGARPLRRAISKYLSDPLAEQILVDRFAFGQRIRVRLAGDHLVFDPITTQAVPARL